MDFKNAQELLELCHTNNLPVSAIMKKRECILGGTTEKAIYDQMNHSLQIMRDSVTSPIQSPKKSIGGLIGGEAQLVNQHRIGGNSIIITSPAVVRHRELITPVMTIETEIPTVFAFLDLLK